MSGTGTTIDRIKERNALMIKEAVQVRPVSTSEIIKRYRKSHPYHGWVQIDSELCPSFVMLCVNDEAVALDTIWNGRFGYEHSSLWYWSRLAARSTTVVDVGAHVGYFSLVAALANPEAAVHGYEPVPLIFARLQTNQRINQVSNLVVHNQGVSDRSGSAEINIRFPMNNLLSTGSSLEALSNAPSSAYSTTVQLITLDEAFADRKVDVIKIDVEGHEPHVLAGARAILERDRPAVLLEVLQHTPVAEVTQPFAHLDYTAYWISEEDGTLRPVSESRPTHSRNMLLMPSGHEALAPDPRKR